MGHPKGELMPGLLGAMWASETSAHAGIRRTKESLARDAKQVSRSPDARGAADRSRGTNAGAQNLNHTYFNTYGG